MAAIVALVVVGAVAIVLAIGEIVLFVIGKQVRKRETVMHGDVVDGSARIAALTTEEVGGRRHAARDFADETAFTAPVTPQRAAVAVVPFRPLRGKLADLIAAEADFPGFGDELDLRQHRILADRGEEAARAVKAARPARQRGGEVEAKTVDLADLD